MAKRPRTSTSNFGVGARENHEGVPAAYLEYLGLLRAVFAEGRPLPGFWTDANLARHGAPEA